jgi:hypothetical protein
LQAQLALVFPLVHVTDRACGERIAQRTIARTGKIWVVVLTKGIELVHRDGSRWIGAQKSCNLRGLHLIHAKGVSLERWVGDFKLCLRLAPRQAFLSGNGQAGNQQQRHHA